MGQPRRWLLLSVSLHALVGAIAFLLALRSASRADLPPIYQVDLVAAADVAPQPTRPEPRPVEAVEEEVPEPEAEEEIPDPDREPPPEETPKPAAREETPRAGPERDTRRGPDLPVTLEGRPFEFPWYLEALVRKVERNWRPAGNTLRSTVYFRIDRSGRVHQVRVAESSGSFLFDQAAQRAVEASNPMPPLPEEYSGDYLGVYFDFDTSVRPR